MHKTDPDLFTLSRPKCEQKVARANKFGWDQADRRDYPKKSPGKQKMKRKGFVWYSTRSKTLKFEESIKQDLKKIKNPKKK